jgi:hypothetical protein
MPPSYESDIFECSNVERTSGVTEKFENIQNNFTETTENPKRFPFLEPSAVDLPTWHSNKLTLIDFPIQPLNFSQIL